MFRAKAQTPREMHCPSSHLLTARRLLLLSLCRSGAKQRQNSLTAADYRRPASSRTSERRRQAAANGEGKPLARESGAKLPQQEQKRKAQGGGLSRHPFLLRLCWRSHPFPRTQDGYLHEYSYPCGCLPRLGCPFRPWTRHCRRVRLFFFSGTSLFHTLTTPFPAPRRPATLAALPQSRPIENRRTKKRTRPRKRERALSSRTHCQRPVSSKQQASHWPVVAESPPGFGLWLANLCLRCLPPTPLGRTFLSLTDYML